MEPLDDQLASAMDYVFETIKVHPDNTDTDDQLRTRVAVHSLKGLIEMLLYADANPDKMTIDLKRLSLGLLATVDWLGAKLPDLPGDDIPFPPWT